MDRIKTRIALLLAVVAAAGVFTASPAPAAGTCHPMPQVYCNWIQWLNDCVFWPPPADYCND